MAMAEKEGLRKGCVHGLVDTFSFQALLFMKNRGIYFKCRYRTFLK